MNIDMGQRYKILKVMALQRISCLAHSNIHLRQTNPFYELRA